MNLYMVNPLPLIFDDSESVDPASGGANQPARVMGERKLLIFTQQWTRHQLTVRAYLASFLGNSIAVDDCIQEVALVVWQKGPWEGDSSEFLGYCLACARRIALAARRQGGDSRLELFSPEAAILLADRVALQEQQDTTPPTERMDALRKCLQKINPEQRELLESRYSGGSKEELRELSKRAGKSMDVLYKSLERLREQLRACVERHQNPTE
jgi:RNA polymerase sigma-70 factor, ECF subfamily